MPVQALDGRPLQVGLGVDVLGMPCLPCRVRATGGPGRCPAVCCCWPRLDVLSCKLERRALHDGLTRVPGCLHLCLEHPVLGCHAVATSN